MVGRSRISEFIPYECTHILVLLYLAGGEIACARGCRVRSGGLQAGTFHWAGAIEAFVCLCAMGLLYVAFYRMRSIDLDFRSHQSACMGLHGFYGQARATDVEVAARGDL